MTNDRKIRTRFAPSLKGFLHIGGAPTALFNWLYTRRQGGTFILRLEDTDQARSTDESTKAILDAMEWLGDCRRRREKRLQVSQGIYRSTVHPSA